MTGGRRIAIGEGDGKLTFPHVETSADGQLLLTWDLLRLPNEQAGVVYTVRDLSWLANMTKENLLRQACNYGLGNEGARTFSPEEMQTGALRQRPDLKNPCSGVSPSP